MQALPSLVALVAAALLTPPILRHLRREGLTQENWRGVALPFPAGIAIVAAGVLALGAGGAFAQLAEEWGVFSNGTWLATQYGLGVALLGLIDDLLSGSARGWRGHAAAVRTGEFSTGALKAVGSLALALYLLGFYPEADHYLLAVALVVLTTNLFNLLDLRPGRCAKAFALLGAGLTLGAWDLGPLWAVGPLAAPALLLGLYDLRERAMLGDTGANLIGALAGVWLVLALDTTGQAVALAVVAAITVYAEFRSLSALIERTPLLRQIDSIGRNDADA